MSVAYLQPTYAKIFIDDTVLNENLSWFQQQSRYAAATFIGLVETFSYRSLHVLFELATFPLSLGYVATFHEGPLIMGRGLGEPQPLPE